MEEKFFLSMGGIVAPVIPRRFSKIFNMHIFIMGIFEDAYLHNVGPKNWAQVSSLQS